jgi:hypothetical protein
VYIHLPLAATAAVLLLGACSSPETQVAERASALPETQRAYAIGTYAVDCRPAGDKCIQAFNSISAHYRSKDGQGVEARLRFVSDSMMGDNTVPDYIRPDRQDKGSYFCLALPPGAYSIYGYDFINFAGGGTGYRFLKKNEFDLPFTLAPGEVVYLGTIKMTTGTGKNILDMTLNAPGIMMLSSAHRDGIDAALKKCPESVRGRPVRDASLRVADANTPFVVADSNP